MHRYENKISKMKQTTKGDFLQKNQRYQNFNHSRKTYEKLNREELLHTNNIASTFIKFYFYLKIKKKEKKRRKRERIDRIKKGSEVKKREG